MYCWSTDILELRLLRDGDDLGKAVVEVTEELGGFDGHAPQEFIEGLGMEQRLQRQ